MDNIEIEYLEDELEIGSLIANPALSNEFCQYYDITDEYAALVFAIEFPSTAKLLRILVQERPKGIIIPEKFGLVYFKEYEASMPVAIIKKLDNVMNLTDFVKQHGPLQLNVIKNQLLPTLINLMELAEHHNLGYGNINPDNILISETGEFILNQCFSSLNPTPGYCIPPELIDCNHFSLGRSVAADLYSLGLTLYYATTGDAPWNKTNISDYRATVLQNGTLAQLSQTKTLTAFWAHLIANLVETHEHRLNLQILRDYLEQDYSNTYKKPSPRQEIKIYFNGKKFTSLPSLLHELFCNWQDAIIFIQDGSIIKYLLSQQNNLNIDESYFTHLNPQEKLHTLFKCMDPNDLIRNNQFAFTIQALPDALTYAYICKDTESLNKITNIISNWHNVAKYKNVNNYDIQNAASIYNPKDKLFNVERVLYSTNKYLQCLSEVALGSHALSLEHFLTTIEQKLEQENFEIDSHLIAFLASKVDASENINQLQYPIHLVENEYFKFLYLLARAYKMLPDIKIVNLCRLCLRNISMILNDILHNLDTKDKLQIALRNHAKGGNPDKMLETLSDPKLYSSDFNGYTAACKQMHSLNKKLNELEQKSLDTANVLFYGQKVTVIFAYLISITISLIVII